MNTAASQVPPLRPRAPHRRSFLPPCTSSTTSVSSWRRIRARIDAWSADSLERPRRTVPYY